MHKTGGFLHIQRILKRDIKRARRDKECAPQQQTVVQQDDTYRFEQEEEELRFAPGFYGLFASRDTQQIGNLQIFCIKGEDVTVDVTGAKAAEKCNNDCL